jgi:hypothetical protein
MCSTRPITRTQLEQNLGTTDARHDYVISTSCDVRMETVRNICLRGPLSQLTATEYYWPGDRRRIGSQQEGVRGVHRISGASPEHLGSISSRRSPHFMARRLREGPRCETSGSNCTECLCEREATLLCAIIIVVWGTAVTASVV